MAVDHRGRRLRFCPLARSRLPAGIQSRRSPFSSVVVYLAGMRRYRRIGGSVWSLPGHVVLASRSRIPFRAAEILPDGELQLDYSSPSRAIAILEQRPSAMELDGVQSAPELLDSGKNWALLLPRGKHSVKIRMRRD